MAGMKEKFANLRLLGGLWYDAVQLGEFAADGEYLN